MVEYDSLFELINDRVFFIRMDVAIASLMLSTPANALHNIKNTRYSLTPSGKWTSVIVQP